MLSPLRNRFGIPGVISVIALVFAMFGGAYAANNSSSDSSDASASAKKKNKAKKGPRGPRGFRGKAGAAGLQGPAGPQGPAGANGQDGSNGSNGANGTNGTSVTSFSFEGGDEPAGEPCEELGGTAFNSASGTTYACNGEEGEEGSPWTAGGTLPSGETETGSWYGQVEIAPVAPATTASTRVPISFPIPLAAPITGTPNWEVIPKPAVPPVPVPAECDDGEEPAASPENPEADPGHLCVFTANTSATPPTSVAVLKAGSSSLIGNGASPTGALITVTGAEGAFAYGTFAVTAP